jgi:hypothetical protein
MAHRNDGRSRTHCLERDPPQDGLGVGMRRVLERDDGGCGIRIMITHASHETRHGADRGVLHSREVRGQVERLRTYGSNAYRVHA